MRQLSELWVLPAAVAASAVTLGLNYAWPDTPGSAATVTAVGQGLLFTALGFGVRR